MRSDASNVLAWLTDPFREVFDIPGVVLGGGALFDVVWWSHHRHAPKWVRTPQIKDYDLLVPTAQVPRVQATLVGAGFRSPVTAGFAGSSSTASALMYYRRAQELVVDIIQYPDAETPGDAVGFFDLRCLHGYYDGIRTVYHSSGFSDICGATTVAIRSLPSTRAPKYIAKGIAIQEPWPRIPPDLQFQDEYRWGRKGGSDWRTWPLEAAVQGASFGLQGFLPGAPYDPGTLTPAKDA